MSAAGNLLAVVIFSRMAGPAEYGHYVFIYAWSLIAYGFSAQWMRFAYFGVYHLDRFGEYIASLARLLAAGLAVAALVLLGIGLFGLFEPSFLAAVFALVCGMAIYEAAFEVARTLLNARGASLAMILRAVLTVGFGSAALYLDGGARGLAIAIALAHLIAAVAGARDLLAGTLAAFVARRGAAYRQLWLAAAVVVRRHRGGPEHRSAAAGALSRDGDARTLWRRCRHVAAELRRGRRSHHPVAGDGGEDAGQSRRRGRRRPDAAKGLQCLPRRGDFRRGVLHRLRRRRAAGGAAAGIRRADARSHPDLRHRLCVRRPCAISILRR